VVPDGQVVVHVGVETKDCASPEASVTDKGLIATETKCQPPVFVMVTIAAALCLVFPKRVAFTKIPTVPAVLPAVNVTGEPAEVFSEPIALLVMVHEYEVPDGQVELHVGVATKDCEPPRATVAPVGLIATEVRVIGPAPYSQVSLMKSPHES
jgi:hypothetical protein